MFFGANMTNRRIFVPPKLRIHECGGSNIDRCLQKRNGRMQLTGHNALASWANLVCNCTQYLHQLR